MKLDWPSAPVVSTPVSMHLPTASLDQFDVSRQIALFPPFQETKVDSHFNAFEHMAKTCLESALAM